MGEQQVVHLIWESGSLVPAQLLRGGATRLASAGLSQSRTGHGHGRGEGHPPTVPLQIREPSAPTVAHVMACGVTCDESLPANRADRLQISRHHLWPSERRTTHGCMRKQ